MVGSDQSWHLCVLYCLSYISPFRPRKYLAEKKVDEFGDIDRNVYYRWRLFLILLWYFFPVVQIKSFRSCQIFFDTLLNLFANIIEANSFNIDLIMIVFLSYIILLLTNRIGPQKLQCTCDVSICCNCELDDLNP